MTVANINHPGPMISAVMNRAPVDDAVFKEMSLDVLRWNQVAGNEPSEEMYTLYTNLVLEEYKELYEDGFMKNSAVDVVDAVCDLYVVGTYFKYVALMLDSEESPTSLTNEAHYMDYITKEGIDMLNGYGYNAVGAFAEVMRSNWSKFPKVEDIVDADAEARWIEVNRGQEGVTYNKVHVVTTDQDHYVFRNANGKIVKPSVFSEPDLEPFVNFNSEAVADTFKVAE